MARATVAVPNGERGCRPGYRKIGNGFLLNPWYDIDHYGLFNMLAGVRERRPALWPISPPRGLPDDVCPEIREESDLQCGHSHSYTQLDELRLYFQCYPAYCDFVPDFLAFLDEIEKFGDPDDIRIVFFFDN